MNYNNAIEKAIVFIESHLAASFTVEDAAREAGYSYYHLNLQFSAVLGESVGSYIKSSACPMLPGNWSTRRDASLTLRWTMGLNPAKPSAGPLRPSTIQVRPATGKPAGCHHKPETKRGPAPAGPSDRLLNGPPPDRGDSRYPHRRPERPHYPVLLPWCIRPFPAESMPCSPTQVP